MLEGIEQAEKNARFLANLETITQLVLRARTHFDIWWEYEAAETKPVYIDVREEYSYFFRFDVHAHFLATIVQLALIFETRADTINLQGLLRTAEGAGIAPGSVSSARSVLAESVILSKKLMILRSNSFVHRSSKLSFDEVFEKAEISPDEIRTATDLALRCVNHLRAASGLEEWEFRDHSKKQLRRVLKKLAASL